MKDDLISRKAALELLGEPHPLDYNAIANVQKIIALPSVPAVPLDKLCEWLAAEQHQHPMRMLPELFERFLRRHRGCKQALPEQRGLLAEGDPEDDGGISMDIHILRTAVQPEGEKLTLAEMRKQMPPCPICGKKAYLDHFIVDGFDFGYDAGCPAFRLDDGVHGISEPYHPDAPHINSWSAEKAFNGWLEYCERMKGRADHA